MIGRVVRCLTLPAPDRWMVARAYVSLAAVDVTLRCLGFRHFARSVAVTGAGRERTVDPDDITRARQYAVWIEAASRHHIIQARCLHRSLVLNSWLRHEGLPSELRIGVRRDGDGLDAHAWVELGGEVVNDPASRVVWFTPLMATSGASDLPTGILRLHGSRWL